MSDPTVSCEDCDEEVSVEASKCPHCGGSITTKTKIIGMMIAVPIVGLFLIPVMIAIFPSVIVDDVGGPAGVTAIALAAVGLLEVGFYSMYQDRKEAVEQAKQEATTE